MNTVLMYVIMCLVCRFLNRASVTQSALRGCVFVLKFGWCVCWTFRKLYPAALAFQQADIYSSSL